MSHATNSGDNGSVERRSGTMDRRNTGERRNWKRLSHLKGECRNNLPRRSSDNPGKMIEGGMWWDGI